ncbi:hypothetical protein BX616_005819 [Lobosporangium transversale]|nr:hypothetical protein BX616_005819 [Lobosporangium transversale]
MPAPINTINQDFCLFDQDETSFDYPLFNGQVAPKTLKTAQSISSDSNAATLNCFNNQLNTPQTPSLNLVNVQSPAGLGFDSCAAFLEDSVSQNLIDTPFSSYMDTPLLDTPLETPYLNDLILDSELDSKLAANASALPLFSDFGLDFAFTDAYSVELNSILPLNPVEDIFPSPSVSPTKSVVNDFSDDEDDEDEFVSSRAAALVSGLKRKADDSVPSPKKIRATEVAQVKKPAPQKRFPCSFAGCDRRFARLFNLHTHEKTHDPTQARPFICSEADCRKAFSRKHDLQRHEASVHKGERNFACTTCYKPFSRQDGLRRHLAVKGPCSDNAWQAT